MTKILVVSNMFPNKKYPSYGVFVKNFCKQLDSINVKYDISVLTKTNNRIIKILKYTFFYIKTFVLCVCGNYKLVYIHYPSFSAAPVLYANKIRKFRIITNVHGTDVVPLKKEHEKMMINTIKSLKQSDRIVVPSVYYQKLVSDRFDIDINRIFVYPSAGVDTNMFYKYSEDKRMSLRRNYGVADKQFVAGFVGRINKAKGWDVFLDALEMMDFSIQKNLSVIIVGSGEDDDLLTDRINKLPEQIRNAIIRFPLLEQEKLADVYNIFDVFIFPTMSESESLGLVAIEAMACGTPVIASDFAAPKYYVENGINGIKFEKGNSCELSKCIAKYFNMTKSCKEELSNGAYKAAEKYARSNIEKGLKELLK